MIAAFERNAFDLLVFAGRDRTRMPPRLLAWIGRNYQPVAGYTALEVYRRNPASMIAARGH